MAKARIWMPFYFGDYLADTGHLSCEQHGAYLLLIARYWMNGGPLPDDAEYLANTCKLTTEKWQTHSRRIAELFRVGNGAWKHKRIEEELLKAKNASEAKKNAGKAAAEARWGNEKVTDAQQSHSERITDVQRNDTSSPSSSSSQSTAKPKTHSPRKHHNGTPMFSQDQVLAIYALYPRRVGPTAAHRAIEKALVSLAQRGEIDPAGLLIDRVTKFAASPSGNLGKHTPHPATWFNAGRYDDDPNEWSNEARSPATTQPPKDDWQPRSLTEEEVIKLRNGGDDL